MLPPGARPVHAISGGPFEDVALLAQHLVLATQALELVHDVLFGRGGRRRPRVLVLRHPARERRTVHPKIVSDRALGAPTRQNEADGLSLKLSRKTGLRHGDPPASYRALHFSDASPPPACENAAHGPLSTLPSQPCRHSYCR